MATKPASQPAWDSSNTNVVVPPNGKIVSGWATNDVPPSGFFNWFWQLVSNWISYLNDSFFVGTSPGGPGLDATGGAPSNTIAGGDGLHGHGTAGTAGSANGGNGVIGDAATSVGGSPGIGVKGNAANQAGSAGVQGNGAGPAPGVQAAGTATRPALNLVPQATPSTPASGDVWVDTTTGGAAIQASGGLIKLSPTLAPVVVGSGGGAPAFQNNWNAPVVPLRYYKDASGVVHIDGDPNQTVGSANNSVIFTLPAGFRPPYARTFFVGISQAGISVVITVALNGNVSFLSGNYGTDTSYPVDVVSFNTI